jgi:hypothetical protein
VRNALLDRRATPEVLKKQIPKSSSQRLSCLEVSVVRCQRVAEPSCFHRPKPPKVFEIVQAGGCNVSYFTDIDLFVLLLAGAS